MIPRQISPSCTHQEAWLPEVGRERYKHKVLPARETVKCFSEGQNRMYTQDCCGAKDSSAGCLGVTGQCCTVH